jgi:peptidoglycan/LPS O-acetylase OafA/YrhL
VEAPLASGRRLTAPELSYRPDIDGLRAIAVVAVVGYHAFPKSILSGFTGVDVFFVISGYLISSLIMNGLNKGTFSFVDFYARRIRRIFPALIVLLAFVWGFGWVAYDLDLASFIALSKHIVAGAAFAANIVTFTEVGYFDVPATLKPLLHLWSLGVEEQFYFIFPVLLYLLWHRKSANLILTLFAVASFVLNVVTVRYSQPFAFFLPFTRFWEFLAGTFLAYDIIRHPGSDWAARFERSGLLDNAASAVGTLLICGGVFLAPAEGDYPGWWASLPVIGTGLVIWAGQHAWINRKILASRGFVFIGLISYPLYLWHWPLLVMGKAIVSDHSPLNPYTRTTTIVVVVVSFVLAWLTFEFVERPIRTGGIALRKAAVASAVALAAVALVAVVSITTDGFVTRYPKDVRALLIPPTALDWPRPDEGKSGPLVVAYGDSNAQHLIPGLTVLQKERTFRAKLIQWLDCPAIPYALASDDVDEVCRKQQAAIEQEFTRLKPDIVVMGALWSKYKHIERLYDTLHFFKRIGVRKIVILGQVPWWPKPPQALLHQEIRKDPAHIPDRLSVYYPDSSKYDDELKAIAAAAGATYISTRDILCNEQGCLVRAGDTAKDILQVDFSHFSTVGSWYLISRIADKIFDGIPTAQTEPANNSDAKK